MGIQLDELPPVEVHAGKCRFDKLADGMYLAGSDDVIASLVLLQHEPHRFYVLFRIAPIALGVEAAEGALDAIGHAIAAP